MKISQYQAAISLESLSESVLTRTAEVGGISDTSPYPVSTQQIENFISEKSGKDLSAFFNQYLRDTRIPTLEYKMEDGKLQYRYTNIVDGFDMPIEVTINGKLQWIFPTNNWQTLTINSKSFEVKRDYYIQVNEF